MPIKDFKILIKDLYRSVSEKDVRKLQKIFFKYPGLLEDERCMNTTEVLLMEATNCDDERITKIVVKFLKFGGTEDRPDNQLNIALTDGNVNLADLLLRNGATIKGMPMKLYYKIFEKKNILTRKNSIKLLAKYNQIDPKLLSINGWNILFVFIENVDEQDNDIYDIMDILLDAGVPVDNENFSSIDYAVKRDFYELVIYFISKGCDINKKYVGRQTNPLLISASDQGIELTELFLSMGADINVKNDFGRTALHKACSNNDINLMSLLIRKGADISAEDIDGKTPLMYIEDVGWNDDHELAVKFILKEFAKMTFENIFVSMKDINYINSNPEDREYFQKSLKELNLWANKKFYVQHTYYSVLKMSKNSKKLANFTRNQYFRESFLKNFSFDIYKKDLMDLFNEACEIKDELITIESKLSDTFGNSFPDVVIRKLTNHLNVEDLPSEVPESHAVLTFEIKNFSQYYSEYIQRF